MTWHPPAHSPLSLGALFRASVSGRGTEDPRTSLAHLLTSEYGAEHVVLTDSGTHALQLGLSAASSARGGRRAALPAFSCFDLVTAALGAGVEPVFYDLDPVTLDPEAPSFRRALETDGVAAAVVAPLFGRPGAWEWIREAARAADVILIEDAAQGVGSTWQGFPAGAIGEMSILSFGRGKGWTGGGGGALLIRTPEVKLPEAPGAPPAAAPILARSTAQWVLGRPSLYGLPSRLPWLGLGETRFHPPTPPSRMAPVSARLALQNRTPALEAADRRHRTAEMLRTRLDLPNRSGPRAVGDSRGSWLRFPLRLPSGMATFDDPVGASRLGVIGSYPDLLPALVAPDPEAVRAGPAWPGARALVRELVTLPTHRWIGPAEAERLAALLEGLDATPIGAG